MSKVGLKLYFVQNVLLSFIQINKPVCFSRQVRVVIGWACKGVCPVIATGTHRSRDSVQNIT